MKARRRTNLIPVRFPGWRTQVPAHTCRECERRLQAPFVLRIEFVFIHADSPCDRQAFGQCGAGFVNVIVRLQETHGTIHLGEPIMESRTTAAIQRHLKTSRLNASSLPRLEVRAAVRQPGWVDRKRRERVGVRKSTVPGPAEFAPEA